MSLLEILLQEVDYSYSKLVQKEVNDLITGSL